jgi:hypothetical protein
MRIRSILSGVKQSLCVRCVVQLLWANLAMHGNGAGEKARFPGRFHCFATG